MGIPLTCFAVVLCRLLRGRKAANSKRIFARKTIVHNQRHHFQEALWKRCQGAGKIALWALSGQHNGLGDENGFVAGRGSKAVGTPFVVGPGFLAGVWEWGVNVAGSTLMGSMEWVRYGLLSLDAL